MHAKTDSEVTSLAPSSPDHTRRPVYYVQSPSHDGEKTTTSFHSSPVHSHSSVGHHTRRDSDSSTRYSGAVKPGSTKISLNDAVSAGKKHRKDCDVIEEEGYGEDDERSRRSVPRRCYFLAFVIGFFVLFSLFALIIYGASKPMKPKITMKSITFETFAIQAGSDSSGVATDMISTNSTVKFLYRNTATFFGVRVSSSSVDVSFSEITIGSGTVKEFYQSRKSQKNVAVSVIGNKIPMYGSGASLSTPSGTTAQPVPLKLNFMLRSKANILGKLVKPKFYKTIDCSIVLNTKKLNVPIPLKNCTYT